MFICRGHACSPCMGVLMVHVPCITVSFLLSEHAPKCPNCRVCGVQIYVSEIKFIETSLPGGGIGDKRKKFSCTE